MSERDDDIQPAIPDTSKNTDEENEEARQQKALQELFLILESHAEREGKPVNAVIRTVPILITTGKERTFYMLRINPAIAESGKLKVAVLDLYREEIHHVQQWVVKAEWVGGLPKITGLDESMAEEGARLFVLTGIAEHAGSMLRGTTKETDAIDTQAGLAMIMSPEYSKGTN